MNTPEMTYTEVDVRGLEGNMGAVGLALTVLAFSAPLTVLAGFLPISLMFGGVGSPVAFIIGTVAILIFSVGYVAFNNIVKRPGDFYAFISYGIGKSAGLGAGFLAAVSYFLLLACIVSFFGVSCADLQSKIMGWHFSWYIFSIALWLAVGVLGYHHVELSARILTFAMVVEIIICLIFSGFAIVKGSPSFDHLSPFTPRELLKNSPIFTVLFVVNYFLGFEATALFRDEVKNPDETIPRATYGAVIFIGFLYTLCAYAMICAYGPGVKDVATNTPSTMFLAAFSRYISPRLELAVSIIVLTSAFAAAVSIQNVLARYIFNLGGDGALPRFLSKVHDKHASPYVASTAASVLVLALLLPFILNGVRPDLLYGQFAGVATAAIIILMTAVSVATLVWYARDGRRMEANPIKLLVAPMISSCFFGALVFLVGQHFELLAGGEEGQYVWMFYSLFAIPAAGFALARYYKRYKPEIFERLGRS